MLNRRQLLIGTAATAAVASLPASATVLSGTHAVSNVVADSVIDYLRRGIPYEDEWHVRQDIDLNKRLITKYPELFPPERHIFSSCPTNLFYSEFRGRAAFGVRTKAYHARYKMELLQDIRTVNGSDAVEDMIIDELAAELRRQQQWCASVYGQMFSYMPARIIRMVCPDTWCPTTGFKMRYALVPKDYHLMTAEEDQKLEKLRYGIV